MDLGPLLSASPLIQVHAIVAMAAFALGLVQFAGPKGTLSHRGPGYFWTAPILAVAASSFGIHEIRQWNGFSLIPLISFYVLASASLAVWAARRNRVARHRASMIGLFTGGPVIAGALNLHAGADHVPPGGRRRDGATRR